MRSRRRSTRARALLALGALLAGLGACARGVPPLVTRPAAAPRATLIRYVAIFDGVELRRTGPRDVLIDGWRIRRIARPGTLEPPLGAEVIDGTGMTVLPGLIDLHGHVGNASGPPWERAWPDPERNLQSYLYAGVTTVLDPADLAPGAFARREAVARGEVLGPRILAAGPMFTTPGGHPVAVLRLLAPWWIRWYLVPRVSREVATPEAARQAVAALAAARPDVVKVAVDAIPLDAPSLGGEVLRAVVEEARAHGLRTVAHVGTAEDALAAAGAGVAAWMHGVYKERIPDDLVPRFAAAGIPYVATSVVFDAYADLLEGRREATDLERETAGPEVLARFAPLPADFAPPGFRSYFDVLTAAREARCDNVRRLHAAGVTVLAGSDAQSGVFPGPGLHRELAILVRCGLAPSEALRAATGAAARFLAGGPEPDFGIVAEGKLADLLLVEGDPTVEIEALSRIRAVFQNGTRLERHPHPAAAG